ncbi:MAG: TolC family protein, partial [Prolixibacteraceae bacterium]|nr:TolC family protein [Prolixibacteraceae bacterium]
MKNWIILLLLLWWFGQMAETRAQELLTLDRTLEIAYENSPSIKQSKLNLVRSRESLNAQNAALKSKFFLNVNPFSYNNNRSFDELQSTWYTSKSMSSSGTFGISQPIKATDGTISLINNFGWQNSYSDYSEITSNTYYNNLSVQFDQPIFTYNRTKMNLHELELDLENALLSYAMQKLSIERQVSQYFYRVYQQQQSLIISREEMSNQQQSYEIIKNKVEAGLAAREELWQAELNLANARSSVYNAEVSLENA